MVNAQHGKRAKPNFNHAGARGPVHLCGSHSTGCRGNPVVKLPDMMLCCLAGATLYFEASGHLLLEQLAQVGVALDPGQFIGSLLTLRRARQWSLCKEGHLRRDSDRVQHRKPQRNAVWQNGSSQR